MISNVLSDKQDQPTDNTVIEDDNRAIDEPVVSSYVDLSRTVCK
jgi:hypothetical protein